MKRIQLLSLSACLIGMMSCTQKDLYQGDDIKETPKVANTFDFSTVSKANVSISYVNTGLPTTETYFEVYVEEPITWSEEGSCIKKEGLNPLFCGYTNSDGVFDGTLELPAYATKLYVYSPTFFATTLMSADITEGKITISDKDAETRVASRAGDTDFPNVTNNNTTRAIDEDHWNNLLGDWDNKTGQIKYAFTNVSSPLYIKKDKAAELMTVHTSHINIDRPCPTDLRTSKDLKVCVPAEKKALGTTGAEVAITLLGGNTCWSSSLGYYYYKDGEQPTSYKELVDKHRIILIVPNTQDGKSTAYNSFNSKGINRGTTVQLFYYGDNLDKDKKQAQFPDGIRIGFVLFSHAWSNNASNCSTGGTDKHKIIASTTPRCNVGNVNYTEGSGCAMYTYDNEYILMSFEDHNNDQNFSDVVFTMSTNPTGSFTDVNIIKDAKKETTMENGIYCFEDLWPSKGDYDMNDVMVNCKTTKTTETKTVTTTIGTSSTVEKQGPFCTSESFEFSIYKNYAALTNGLAFTIETDENAPSNVTYAMTVDGQKTDFKQDGNVFYITPDVNKMLEKKIVVTATYAFDSKVNSNIITKVHPFIYREKQDGNWEVHIPYEAPTRNMNLKYFGTEDDATVLANKNYYTREGNFPFAFFLSNASEKDVKKLLDKANESTSIDKLYPKWNDWVKNSGKMNADWYKQ